MLFVISGNFLVTIRFDVGFNFLTNVIDFLLLTKTLEAIVSE